MPAGPFANGLLPEGQHRQALADELKIPTNDLYSMLARFGRDVAGALIIALDDPGERPGSVIPYTKESLQEEVTNLPARPLAIHDDSELSIAGLQDKLLLVALPDGRWGRPAHGYPSSHILKVDDPRHPGLVAAEAECLHLARAVGLTNVEAHTETIADTTCLIVSRFDRRTLSDGTVERVHQEDICQALARDPQAARGRGKYEDAGGPSLREVAALLDRYATNPPEQLDRLLTGLTFTVAIGNADAHGKNIALLHPTAEIIELAPLYDTVPTVLWPKLRSKGAMAINDRWQLASITANDLIAEAVRWRHDPIRARRTVTAACKQLLDAVGRLPDDSAVANQVTIRAHALLAQGRP